MNPSQVPDIAQTHFGLAVSEEQLDQLSTYVSLLRNWSERVRLISRKDREHIWERHVIDCLSIVSLTGTDDVILDLGSGAGLPGLVISVMARDCPITLMEPTRMKSLFLREVIRELGLSNTNPVKCRAEDLRSGPAGLAKFTFATARAVGPLPQLVKWVEPLLARDGVFVAMKGPSSLTEFSGAVPPHLAIEETCFKLPLTGRDRCLVSIRFT